ncbi:MAG TPA: hypothetical protein VGE62_01360 [Candidatus Paceibacterota bacterium]
MNTRKTLDKSKYLLTFLITAIIFGSMLYVNSMLDSRRIADVKSVQDQISLDLLSSETQFSLLKETSCRNLSDSILSQELNSLATKLSYLESNNSANNLEELTYVKKYYSLLQIKDSILMQQLGQKCTGTKPISILYFYGNKSDCSECEKMSYVLTYLRQQYPELRIYSFDTNLELSALETLKSIYGIKPTELPALVYNDEAFVGFKTIEEVREMIPEIKKIDEDRAKAAAERLETEKATATAATTTRR